MSSLKSCRQSPITFDSVNLRYYLCLFASSPSLLITQHPAIHPTFHYLLSEMASNAQVLSTQLIAVLALGARSVKVGYVEKTDIWRRVALSPEIQQKFKETTGKHLSSIKDETDMVALQ